MARLRTVQKFLPLLLFPFLVGCSIDPTMVCARLNCSSTAAESTYGGTFRAADLQKVTTTDAILKTGSSAGTDINQWLINIGETWKPTTFNLNNKVYFSVPSKINDSFSGGWHRLFASWSPGDTSVTWSNGNIGGPGTTPDWGKFDTANDGNNTNNDQKTFSFVVGPSSLIYGLGVMRTNQAGAATTQFAVRGVTSSALLHLSSVDTAHPNVFTFTHVHELYSEGGTIYDFWTDEATHSVLTLTQTTDMLTPSAADITLSNHLGRANVMKYGTTYLMVAYNTTSQHWELYRSNSLTSWDFTNPVDLNLRSFVGGAGKWDQNAFSSFASGEPLLAGVRLVGENVYVFYLAGDYDYPGAAPYGQPRGIGVLTAAMVRD